MDGTVTLVLDAVQDAVTANLPGVLAVTVSFAIAGAALRGLIRKGTGFFK